MKKIFFIVVLFATVTTQKTLAQNKQSQLLSFYYDIKDALVAGNANTAASKAEAFIKYSNSIDYKEIPEGNINTLLKDAGKISESKNIKTQREYFANLSSNMIALVKALKLSDQPIYKIYCPMKKQYWLSNEKSIKNPYFGSSMLTCGEVVETFQ